MVFCVLSLLSLRFWTTVVIYLVPIWMTCVFVENRFLPTTSVPKVNLVHLRLFWVHRVNKCMPLWQSWAHFHQDERCNGTSDTRRACEDDSEVWKSSWGRCCHSDVFTICSPVFTGAPTKTCCFFVNNLQNKRDVFVLGDAFGPQVPMKNEGFRPSIYGSWPPKMKVLGSHGVGWFFWFHKLGLS